MKTKDLIVFWLQLGLWFDERNEMLKRIWIPIVVSAYESAFTELGLPSGNLGVVHWWWATSLFRLLWCHVCPQSLPPRGFVGGFFLLGTKSRKLRLLFGLPSWPCLMSVFKVFFHFFHTCQLYSFFVWRACPFGLRVFFQSCFFIGISAMLFGHEFRS